MVNHFELVYIGDLDLGSNEETFRFIYDTGSSVSSLSHLTSGFGLVLITVRDVPGINSIRAVLLQQQLQQELTQSPMEMVLQLMGIS